MLREKGVERIKDLESTGFGLCADEPITTTTRIDFQLLRLFLKKLAQIFPCHSQHRSLRKAESFYVVDIVLASYMKRHSFLLFTEVRECLIYDKEFSLKCSRQLNSFSIFQNRRQVLLSMIEYQKSCLEASHRAYASRVYASNASQVLA